MSILDLMVLLEMCQRLIAKNAKYDGFSSSVIEDQTYPYASTGTNISTVKAAPSTSFALAGGNYYEMGENSGIGFFATATFANNYQNTEGTNRVLKADRAPLLIILKRKVITQPIACFTEAFL